MVDVVEMRFPRPEGRVLSTNEANKLHWAVKRRIMQPWRDEMAWAWKLLPLQTRVAIKGVPCRVQVTIGFKTNTKRDPANYVGTVVKGLVDTLVQVGDVWPDDDPRYVTVDEPICVKGDEIIVRLVPRD